MYSKFNNVNNEILLFGEIDILNRDFNDSNRIINTFFYDKVNVNRLVSSIKNNDYKVVKNKKIYLNQLIYSSNYIYIGVNKYDNKIDKLIKKNK